MIVGTKIVSIIALKSLLKQLSFQCSTLSHAFSRELKMLQNGTEGDRSQMTSAWSGEGESVKS